MSRRAIAAAAVTAVAVLAIAAMAARPWAPSEERGGAGRAAEDRESSATSGGTLAIPRADDLEESEIDPEPVPLADGWTGRGLANVHVRPAGDPDRSLDIHVRDRDGELARGVAVRVEPVDHDAIDGRTDANGAFRVARLDAPATVRLEEADSFPVVVRSVRPGVLTIQFVRVVRLSGKVIDVESSRLVAGARIRGMLPLTPARAADVLLDVRTGPDGAFAADAPDVGALRLVVDVPDGRRVERAFVYPKVGPVWILIPLGGRIEGRVLDEARKPVRNARIFARRAADAVIRGVADGFVRGIETGTATSNSDGSYLISGIEPGVAYSIRAEGDRRGRSVEHSEVELDKSGVARVNLVLLPPVSIELELVDESGVPVRGARITVDGNPFATTIEPVNDRGTYQVVGVLPGRWRIHIDTPLGSPQDLTIDAVPGPNRLPVKVDAGVRIDGMAVDRKGLAVVAALITIEREGADAAKRETRTTRTGASGEFAFGQLAVGPWRVSASAPGSTTIDAVTVDAPRRGVRLTLATLGRARLQLLRESGGPVEGDVETRRTRADGDVIHGSGTLSSGVVIVEGFDGHPETLEISAEGYSPYIRDVRIAPEGETDLGAAVMRKGHRLEGVVVGADGVGIRGAFVLVGHHGRVVSGRDGAWTFPGVPSGALTILVVSEFHLKRSIEIDATAPGPFRIALESGAHVEGTVVGADGRGVGGLPVSFTPIAGDLAGEVVERLRTDEDGTFDVRLPPGRYRIEAKDDGDADAVLLADVTFTDGDSRKPTLVYRIK